jgi:hypothetical protein
MLPSQVNGRHRTFYSTIHISPPRPSARRLTIAPPASRFTQITVTTFVPPNSPKKGLLKGGGRGAPIKKKQLSRPILSSPITCHKSQKKLMKKLAAIERNNAPSPALIEKPVTPVVVEKPNTPIEELWVLQPEPTLPRSLLDQFQRVEEMDFSWLVTPEHTEYDVQEVEEKSLEEIAMNLDSLIIKTIYD